VTAPSSGESSTNHTLRSNVSFDRDPARVLASVNAGEKMHQRAGVKDVCGRLRLGGRTPCAGPETACQLPEAAGFNSLYLAMLHILRCCA
jgi:hypothetical protein